MFDKPAVRLLRQQIQAKLNELGEALDFDIQLGSARFTPNNVTFKMEVAKIGDDGVVVNKLATDFNRLAPMYGLTPGHLNKEFTVDGKTYKIAGCKPRCTRYPIMCERNGKMYKFSAHAVQLYLKG